MIDYYEFMPFLLLLPVVTQIIDPLLLLAECGLMRAVKAVFELREVAIG